jgi:putative zinc finger protein
MTEHFGSDDVAAYLDGVLSSAERARVEQHLADCDECRAELIALSRVLRTRPSRRRRYVLVGAAAAAAVVALLMWPESWQTPASPNYREPAVSTTPAPIGLAPRGATAAAPRLVWTRVPYAARYRLTLFDTTGTVIWESQSPDTSVALPTTLRLRPGIRYFWQVEAQTSWNRWIRSDAVQFMLDPTRR